MVAAKPPASSYLPSWIDDCSGGRLAVLGADGFIGSHVVRVALACGADVTALTVKEPWRLRNLAGGRLDVVAVPDGRWWDEQHARELASSFRDASALALLAYRPPDADDDRRRWEHELDVNAHGAARVARAAARQGVAVVFTSSADVYGRWHDRPVGDDALLAPETPYARAKVTAERLLAETADRTALTVLRIATVFGPGENGPRAIPSFVRALRRGECPEVHGDGSDVRDYVHVVDVAAAIVNAAFANPGPSRRARTLNIGSGVGRTTLEVLELVRRTLAASASPRFVPATRPPSRLVLDCTSARAELGFRPRQDFAAALEEEVSWLLEVLPGKG